MLISKSTVKMVVFVLMAFAAIAFYMNNKWSYVTVKGDNERSHTLEADGHKRINPLKKATSVDPLPTGEPRHPLTDTILSPIRAKDDEAPEVPTTKQVVAEKEIAGQKVAGNDMHGELAEKFMGIVAEERLAGLQRGCHVNQKKFGLDVDAILKLHPAHSPRFYFSDKYRLLLCEVPKCGSTSWKKALVTMEGIVNDKAPTDIRGDEAHTFATSLSVWKQYNDSDKASVAKTKERISNYTRIMTVREPLERLVSAYKDKMLPTGSGGERYGAMSKRIHEQYSDNRNSTGGGEEYASWQDFVRYLVDKKRKIYFDAHWQLFSEMCFPCGTAYHYVAKLETIYHDAQYISKLLKFDVTPFFPASKEKGRHDKWSTEYQNYFKELSKYERQRLYEMYMEQYDLFGYIKPTFL